MLRLQRLLHSHLWKGKKKNSLFTVLRKPGARLEKKEGQVTIKNEALLMLVLIGSSRVATLCDWSKKKTRHHFNQSDAKLGPTATWSPAFSRHFFSESSLVL